MQLLYDVNLIEGTICGRVGPSMAPRMALGGPFTVLWMVLGGTDHREGQSVVRQPSVIIYIQVMALLFRKIYRFKFYVIK